MVTITAKLSYFLNFNRRSKEENKCLYVYFVQIEKIYAQKIQAVMQKMYNNWLKQTAKSAGCFLSFGGIVKNKLVKS